MIASAALSKVERYTEAVMSGEQVTGELVKLAVQRHLSDLEKQNTDAFPYYFDTNMASVIIDWYELVCRHSIGKDAGLPFLVEDWQAFGLAMIDGWRRCDDGSRRFRSVYWSTGRKNGKSTWAAARLLFGACADVNPVTREVEGVADIGIAATKTEQADVIFNECCRMVKQSPSLQAYAQKRMKHIDFPGNSGRLRCISSDRGFDGLNLSVTSIDELHAFSETPLRRDFMATMRTGGASRVQPLHLTTTTAGSDRSYMWLEEYNYAKAVVKGEVDDNKWFVWCFELDAKDDILDEANWIKANPNLGVSVSLEFLRDNAKRATQSALWFNEFDRYHCNRCVSSTASAFSMEDWDACAGELSDWKKEADAIGGGIDVGGRDDLCGAAFVARFKTDEVDENEIPIYRYEIKTFTYCSDHTDRDLTTQPFADWVHEDLLKRSSEPITQMARDLIHHIRVFGCEDVAYDPAQAQQLAEQLQGEGIECASMAQTTAMFAEPIADLMQAIKDRRIRHDGNPLLRWMVGNTALLMDHQKRCMYSKRESKEKIDSVVAFTMAYRRAMVAPKRIEGPLVV